MKASFFFASYIVVLITSLVKCPITSLPFSKGKYILWTTLITIISIAYFIKRKNKTLNFNIYDIIITILSLLGLINFILISTTTIYSIYIWYYIGYLTIYLLLRNYCITPDLNKKVLLLLVYFCSFISLINLFWVLLQWKSWVTTTNIYFTTTGLFFSPNHLGLFLAIGGISTLYLLQRASFLWIKICLTCGFLLFIFGTIISESRGAIISLSIALLYFFYQSKKNLKQYLNWKTYAGIGIFIIGSIYYTAYISKNKIDSTSGRFFITQQIAKQITQNPIGYGVNSFSVEYNKNKAEYFEKNKKWEEMKNGGYIFYGNNDYLELAFELGIHWILVFIVFLFLLFTCKLLNTEIIVCRTILLCFTVFSLTNSVISGPIFVILAITSASIIINTSNSKILYKLNPNFLYKPVTIGLLVFGMVIQIERINAENNLYRFYLGNKYLKGENQLKKYLSKIDEKGEELFMSGIILINNGYREEGINYMQKGVDRSGIPSLGRVLSEGLQRQGKYSQAEKIFIYNKNAEPYRYEARMDLLNLFIRTKQKEKAKKMALEIISLPIKIPSPKITEYKTIAKKYLNKP